MPHYREVQPETGGCGYMLLTSLTCWAMLIGAVYGWGAYSGWWS